MQATQTPLLLCLLAAPLFSQGIEEDGPYPVGWIDMTFPDPQGTSLEGRFYYPAVTAGEGAVADPGQGPYPLVGLLHRYVGDPSNYDHLSKHVASWGFFLASIGTLTGPVAGMRGIAQDTADMLNWVAGQSDDPASPFANMIAPGPWGAVGHSMGGGALFYLIEDEPNVRVLVALQPYRGPALGGFAGSIDNLQAFTGDLLLIGGDVDFTAPAATHSYGYFETAQSAARSFHTTVAGLGHQGPTDNPPTNEPLPAAEQSALHRRLVTGFLRAELKDEEAIYLELIGEGVATEPWTQESRSTEPTFWVAPSSLHAMTAVNGIAAGVDDRTILIGALAPASIPTPFGLLGVDPSVASILVSAALPAEGHTEYAIGIPPALLGTQLYFQTVVVGSNGITLSRTASTTIGSRLVPKRK